MNQTITGIVDMLFKDIVVTEETHALHEELMNNCQERYADLVAHGFSEVEAIDAVVESLRGMKEVVDQYPKKQDRASELQGKPVEAPAPAAGPVLEVPAAQEAGPVPEDRRDQRFAAAEKISVHLNEQNVRLLPSTDGWIHVRCEDPDTIACSVDQGRLNVRAETRILDGKKAEAWSMNAEVNSLRDLLNLVGKAIRSVGFLQPAGPSVTLEVPQGLVLEAELNTKSGDIDVERISLRRLSAHSGSGDIDLQMEQADPLEWLKADTASGDVDVRADALEATVTSISGDVEFYGNVGTARLKSVSGDVEMEGGLEKLEMSTVSGDAEIHLTDTRARSISLRSTSGDLEVHLCEGCDSVHCQSSTTSGDRDLNFEDAGPGAALQVTAATISGDIWIG